MKQINTLLLIGLCSLSMQAQTANSASDMKFSKVAAPVSNQSTQGNRPAGEFYHATYTGAAWGDYDNDGYLDLYYSDRNTHISNNTVFNNQYHNSGDGTFTRTLRSSLASTSFSCPVWLDINNDGNLDIVYCGLSNWHYGWNENGSQLGYIKSHAFLGDGTGEFTEITDNGILPIFNGHTGGKGHNWVSAGDYDHDGYVDLVMTGFDDINRLNKVHYEDAMRVVYLYRNIGGERFELQPTPVAGDKALHGLTDGSAVLADLDGDGWLDLFTTGYSEKHMSEGYIYWNNCDGTFSEGDPRPVWALTNASSSVADLDGDGLPDLVLTGIYVDAERKCFTICRNNGDRTFTAVETAGTFEAIDGGQLAFGDVNQDGWTDILVGGHGQQHEHTPWIYVNQGNFIFQDYGAHYNDPFGKLGSFSRVTHGSHHLIDYDNDGYLDVWFLGWANGTCSNGCLTELYHNDSATKGIPANTSPEAPTGLSVIVGNSSGNVELSWSAGSDDFTPVDALRYNIYIKNLDTDEVFMLVPSDLATGFVKVEALNSALSTLTYMMSIPNGDYEWGVQTIDTGNRGSVFATGTFSVASSAVERVDLSAGRVKAVQQCVHYSLNGPATLRVYNMQGMLVNESTVSGSGNLPVPSAGIYVITVIQNEKAQTYKLAL